MRASELTIGTDYLVSDPKDWVTTTWGVHYYRLVDGRPWETYPYGTVPRQEPVTVDDMPVRVPDNARPVDSWRGGRALMVPVDRDGKVRDVDGTPSAVLVNLRTIRTTREDGVAQRTAHGDVVAETRRRTRIAKAADAERAEGIVAALGRGTYTPSGTHVGTLYAPTVTLTLDEAADVATRVNMLRRAAVAEVADVLAGADVRAPERLAEAVVARLAALDEAVGADA